MKDTVIIPVLDDQYKIICTWGNWRGSWSSLLTTLRALIFMLTLWA